MKVFPILTGVVALEFAIAVVDVVARTWPGALLSLVAAYAVGYLVADALYRYVKGDRCTRTT